ncbi:MAG TPA: methylmalonyl Co-A mutase-associated GTPase MeaB [Candidatus Nitrosotalea sp.]|nr:methylmalonyl Co-A mutase-associated GTPase MeaB [Candidatus Nitrosotalea sp.]
MSRAEPTASELVLQGVRGLARAISRIEDGDRDLAMALARGRSRPRVVGFTGPPGSGKSTLLDALVTLLRGQGLRLALIAVDPSSPHTGGALLGDRIRLQRHAQDPGVYVRSLSARGHLGGLTAQSADVVRALGGFDFDLVLLETVGVGQSELEVAQLADTTVLVLAPGLGDSIQHLKSGVMEVADVICLNKADSALAPRALSELNSILRDAPDSLWHPPLVGTVASTGSGVAELWSAIERHRTHLAAGEGDRRGRERIQAEVLELVASWARSEARARLQEEPELLSGSDPRVIAARLLERLRPQAPREP